MPIAVQPDADTASFAGATYSHPPHLLAGFHAERPDPNLPEIVHLGEQWASRHVFISRHTHAVWEFYLQISGTSVWDAGMETYTLAPGGFLAVPPGLIHQMHDQPLEKHHFFFAALDLVPILTRLPAPAWTPGSVQFNTEGGALLPPFRQLVREVRWPCPTAVPACGWRWTLLFWKPRASAPRLLQRRQRSKPDDTRRYAGRKSLLEHQPGRAWRLADLAQMAGLSGHHLVECFTKEVGVSPHRYLLGVRVRLAQEMLSASDLSVTEIALELGFSSSQHFAATFKRLSGETAQSCRARHTLSKTRP